MYVELTLLTKEEIRDRYHAYIHEERLILHRPLPGLPRIKSVSLEELDNAPPDARRQADELRSYLRSEGLLR